jgi:ribosome-associated protein
MTKHNLAVLVNGTPDPKLVVRKVVEACEEVKGRDIAVYDVRQTSDVSDYVVVVSGRSDRQVLGISNRVLDQLAQLDLAPTSMEGVQDAHWVLLDFGDVVVHVFYEPARAYYDIEGLFMRAKRVNVASPAPEAARA